MFISYLAAKLNYYISWDLVSAWENFETSKQVNNGNYELLENLFESIISEL